MQQDGYISEVDYLYGYYAETSPLRLKLALLSCGIGHSVGKDYNYLELGFGQGLSLAINAATGSGKFYGTDFNPAQVANALELAEATGKPICIFEDSFEEFAGRHDIPQFDLIVLHGIWSWVSEKTRGAIIQIARERLKPGGVFYISYNVSPGWSPSVPLRHLLSEYAQRAATGGILQRASSAISFVDRVIDANAAYFAMHPQLKSRLAHMREQNLHYVAHEFFNAEWEPMPFSKVADLVGEAKLTYAGSANILDNLSSLAVPASAAPILNDIADPILRETTLDYFINRQFRRDIFVKGARVLDRHQLRALVAKQNFALVGNPAQLPSNIATSAGEAVLKQEIYRPIVAALEAAEGNVSSTESIAAAAGCEHLGIWQVWEALLVLTGSGFLAPAEEMVERDHLASCKSLNQFICARSEYSTAIQYLASPVTGAGVPVAWLDQLFLKAVADGVDDVPAHVWAILAVQGKQLVVDGTELAGESANIVELRRRFNEFNEERTAGLQRLYATP